MTSRVASSPGKLTSGAGTVSVDRGPASVAAVATAWGVVAITRHGRRASPSVAKPASSEAASVAVALQYLSYFQGTLPDWDEHDPRLLRGAVPENRLRVYDVREVAKLIADKDTWLEL